MRNTRIGAGICLAVGSVALAAPVAGAADAPSGEQTVRISPTKASPGSQVTVSTRACGKETYGKGTLEAGAPSTSSRATGRAYSSACSTSRRAPGRAPTRSP